MKPHTEVTTTTLVLEALRRADDFLTVADLMEMTQRSYNRVQAALHHLWKNQAADFVVSGATYWFARPTSDDTRSRTVEERTAESKPRSKRKGRKVTP